MDLRKLNKSTRGGKSFERKRSASKGSNVSIRTIGREKSKRGEKVQRTFSRLGKKWIGAISDDRKADQLFSQYRTHIKGYLLASFVTPPDIRIESLTRRVMELEEVELKGIVSLKIGRETPTMTHVSIIDSVIILKKGKKKSSKIGNSKLGKSVADLSKTQSKKQKKISLDLPISRFYDLSFDKNRNTQFKVQFYSNSENNKFSTFSFKLSTESQAKLYLKEVLKAVHQMFLYLRNILSQFMKKEKHVSLNMDKCAKYGRCMLDLGFWLFGMNSRETVESIELFEQLLVRVDPDDENEEIANWRERKKDILMALAEKEEEKQANIVEQDIKEEDDLVSFLKQELLKK